MIFGYFEEGKEERSPGVVVTGRAEDLLAARFFLRSAPSPPQAEPSSAQLGLVQCNARREVCQKVSPFIHPSLRERGAP